GRRSSGEGWSAWSGSPGSVVWFGLCLDLRVPVESCAAVVCRVPPPSPWFGGPGVHGPCHAAAIAAKHQFLRRLTGKSREGGMPLRVKFSCRGAAERNADLLPRRGSARPRRGGGGCPAIWKRARSLDIAAWRRPSRLAG